MSASHLHREYISAIEQVHPHLERFVRALVWRSDSRKASDEELCKDIIAETVAMVFENFSKIQHKEALLSYCFTIATRLHRKAQRTERMTVKAASTHVFETVESEIWDEAETYDTFSDHVSERSADVTLLYNALETLPEQQREAVIMFEILGFSMKEISELQERSVISVKVSVSRGRALLAKRLGVS
jgi:RNA polymerase sigma-70 factor (ECF subfamily)